MATKKRFGGEREQNYNWRGGRVVASNGYVLLRVGQGHHLADVRGYAYEHRIIAEQMLGRRLHAQEQVHHRKTGAQLRLPGEPNPLVSCACGCGQTFARYDANGRPRRFVSGHNMHGGGDGN